jgi:hypothetical protein
MLTAGRWTLTFTPSGETRTFEASTPNDLLLAIGKTTFTTPWNGSFPEGSPPLLSTRQALARAAEAGQNDVQHGNWRLRGADSSSGPDHPGASVTNRRRLLILADTAARSRSGNAAAEALIELPKVAAGILEGLAGQPVMAFMAIGEEDVQALQEFLLARQGLAGLQRHVEAQP